MNELMRELLFYIRLNGGNDCDGDTVYSVLGGLGSN